MSSRRNRLVVAGLATVALVGMAVPASAGDTAVTFTLTGGNLTIATPTAAATLSAGALSINGTSVAGALGDTTVKDERGALVQNVTVTMAASDFTNGTDQSTIASTAATGYSGVATPAGTAVPVPTVAGVAIGGSGASILTMASVGSGAATYNPTVSVAVPAGATAGTYTGVITQTVA